MREWEWRRDLLSSVSFSEERAEKHLSVPSYPQSSELNNKQGHDCGLTVGPVPRDTGINFSALRGSQESTDRARGLTMFPIMSFIIPNMSMKPPDCSRE